MHPYSINSEEHKHISLYLAVVAILLAWTLYLFSKNVFPLPWWIEAPSVIGFYGIYISGLKINYGEINTSEECFL